MDGVTSKKMDEKYKELEALMPDVMSDKDSEIIFHGILMLSKQMILIHSDLQEIKRRLQNA